MARFRLRRKINIGRVVAKLAGTVIALYVGGEIMSAIGTIMNGTCGVFNKGLTLIGWTVVTNATGECITAVTGSGILTVVGIVGVASIVMEFIQFKL